VCVEEKVSVCECVWKSVWARSTKNGSLFRCKAFFLVKVDVYSYTDDG